MGEALRDPWGGCEDLANRLIRAVGDPLARFGEDGLRTMRAVRLAALLHDVARPRTAAPRADAPGEFTFFRHEILGAEMADAICRRLKLATQERERVGLLVGQHMFWYAPEWTDGTVLRFLRRV